MDETPIVDDAMVANAYFNWSWKGCGFGQLSFSFEDGKWSCSTEMMGPESTRKLLHAFADHVADRLEPILIEEREQWENRVKMSETQPKEDDAS
jgi:hypothetical protein